MLEFAISTISFPHSIHDRKAVEKKQLQKEILQQEQASEELHKSVANKKLIKGKNL
jgi:hypothetical protein